MQVQKHFSNQVFLEYLVSIFNRLMTETYDTVLEGGGKEPFYLARKNSASKHRIIFTEDYISSALHEISHWCVAGTRRRELDDYGYWYAPDGRSLEQQLEFERVEVKPQAIEWILSKACGVPFKVSADNLELGAIPSERFKKAIVEQAQYFCIASLPARAKILAETFYRDFSTSFEHSTRSHKNICPDYAESTANPFLAASYTLEQLNGFGLNS